MRLLLAEDNSDLSTSLVPILKRNNYSIDTAHTGPDALNALETGLYDGAILDVTIPEMDGIAVLKSIREKGSNIPILLLTTKSEENHCILKLESGADDYLTRPFSIKELLARVRAMTRQQAGIANTILTYHNVKLNCTTYQLSSPSVSFRLANKEFQILEMLMRNPGQVIRTEHFLEKIWGYDADAELNVVWVYISYLRKKLAALDAGVKIKATRNQGYSLSFVGN
jgi:DNA-binding response OmpR family regulator